MNDGLELGLSAGGLYSGSARYGVSPLSDIVDVGSTIFRETTLLLRTGSRAWKLEDPAVDLRRGAHFTRSGDRGCQYGGTARIALGGGHL